MIHIENPYAQPGNWWRGNVHTHTTHSDGSRPVERVLEDYESRGYDFLAITDHDVLVDPAPWQEKTRLALIPGVEVSRGGPHLLHLGATELIPPDPDRQTVLNRIQEQGALGVVNHPNWGRNFNHCPHELMESWSGYIGLEIYNGVIERLPGSPYATDRWDRLLSQGRKVWGFATDDAHHDRDVELGWIVVRAERCEPGPLLEAIARGSFYSSTGVRIERIAVEDRAIRIEAPDAQRIRCFSKHGVLREVVEGSEARFSLPDSPQEAEALGYLRVECYGSGGRVAWTQPFWLNVERA
ncbi:MAG: phosphotransferase [Candidatus Poribacteria bacterium]|nr:MAG: phosphotransferase [Candidatus Poribacteria bacterium]